MVLSGNRLMGAVGTLLPPLFHPVLRFLSRSAVMVSTHVTQLPRLLFFSLALYLTLWPSNGTPFWAACACASTSPCIVPVHGDAVSPEAGHSYCVRTSKVQCTTVAPASLRFSALSVMLGWQNAKKKKGSCLEARFRKRLQRWISQRTL